MTRYILQLISPAKLVNYNYKTLNQKLFRYYKIDLLNDQDVEGVGWGPKGGVFKGEILNIFLMPPIMDLYAYFTSILSHFRIFFPNSFQVEYRVRFYILGARVHTHIEGN